MWDDTESNNKKKYTPEDLEEIKAEEESSWVSVMFIIAVISAFIYRLFRDGSISL